MREWLDLETTGLGCWTRHRFSVTLSISFDTLESLLLICNLRLTPPFTGVCSGSSESIMQKWQPARNLVGIPKVFLYILCGDELAP